MQKIAKNTLPNGTASTYSVARKVQNALLTNGFDVFQIPGFPPKGAMLTALKQANQKRA
jgi:tRNA U34 5-methylaminomethyl-2-thiouridine-forming methyltransferase MnmC